MAGTRGVSVIGVGETKFGRFPQLSLRQMISEAGEKAIADAGIDRTDIQSCYVGNAFGSVLNRQTLIGPLVADALGLGAIPTAHTEAGCAASSVALRFAIASIQAGHCDVALVGGAEKMCHADTQTLNGALSMGLDREAESARGLTTSGAFAMVANRYFYEHRNVRREMALCAVQAHKNAMRNPDAQMPKDISISQVLEAAPIADPLGLYDCSLITDGAAFLIVASDNYVRSLRDKSRVIKIVGSGFGGDVLPLAAKRSLTTFIAAKNAAAEAYRTAGLAPRDIDFAEVHDCFTITQIVNTEDLGFFAPGKGGDAVANGTTAFEGTKPINVSGGLKAKGHPIGATGAAQVLEVVTQLRGEAGERQLPRADTGLTHNLGGVGGHCTVHIMRRYQQ